MSSISVEKYNEFMQAIENHTYTLFDIWEAGRDYQRESDIKVVRKEYLVNPTHTADDIAYDVAITDAINAIRGNN